MTLTPSQASDDDIFKYTEGECHLFALALHRHLGWPMYAVLDMELQYELCEDDFVSAVCHVYALDPDGNAWDIKGVRPAEGIQKEIDDWLHIGDYGTEIWDFEQELLAYVDTAPGAEDRPLAHFRQEGVDQAWSTARQALSAIPAFYEALKQTGAAQHLSDALGGAAVQPAPAQMDSAARYADQYSSGEPGHANAQLLEWFEVSDYPILRLLDAVDLEWFKAEQEMWAEEGEPDRFGDMLNAPIHMPVTIYDDGQAGWTWDGNHRIGATLAKGEHQIRALVGVPAITLTEVQSQPKSLPRPRI